MAQDFFYPPGSSSTVVFPATGATSANQVLEIAQLTAINSNTTGVATAAKQDTGNTSLASIDTKTPTVGQKLMAASSPVVIASDQSAVPVTVASVPLPTGAATEATLAAFSAKSAASLVPAAFDYIALTYSGSNLTVATYKTGGSGGSTVATLTMAYTGSQLDSVTKT